MSIISIIGKIALYYFLFGMPVALGLQLGYQVIARREKPTLSNVAFSLVTYMFWPFFAWAIFNNCWLHAGKCVHCGQVVYGEKALNEHVFNCPANPLTVELAAARKACEWLDQELGAKKDSPTDWKRAGELVIEWLKVRKA